MKLNGGPKQYMPLPQSQSDDDETTALKETKVSSKENGIANGCTKSVEDKETVGNDNEENVKPMSTLRKTFFIFSILLCVFFVVSFIWIIPCKVIVSPIDVMNEDWLLELNNTDMVSVLLLANHHMLSHPVVLLSFKSKQNNGSGLFAIDSITGKIIWTQYVHDFPNYGKFDGIDVNGDQIPECIILGEHGLLFAVNITNGHIFWYYHNHEMKLLPSILLPPISVFSCENNTVYDLVSSYTTSDEPSKPYLVIISGSTGLQKGSSIAVPFCIGKLFSLIKWKYDNVTSVALHCNDNKGNVNVWYISLDQLCQFTRENVSEGWKKLYSLKGVTGIKLRPLERNMIIAWDGVNMVSINENNITWRLFSGYPKLRVLFDGYFTSNKLQIMFITENANGMYKVSLADAAEGNEVWSEMFTNGTLVYAEKVPHIAHYSDGILLKLNSAYLPLSDKINTSVFHWPNSTKHSSILSNIHYLNESYVLLMCWKNVAFRPLIQHTILTRCRESDCYPKMHSSKNTGIMNMNEDGSAHLVVAVSSLIPGNTSFISHMAISRSSFHFQQCSAN